MCEITNKNFEKKCPEILANLRSAAFLSIDCEFSGIHDSELKNSWFESANEIFEKKQKSLRNYKIIEFGLSMFNFDRNSNNFNVLSYSFYLLPFVSYKECSKFTWQLDSVDFLCRYNFDFNKVFYDGISYLNKMEEAAVLDMINNETISEIFNEEDIQNCYCQIFKWSSKVSDGEEMVLELEGKQLALTHVLEFEIRKNIQNVWANHEDGNVIKVKKISAAEKLKLLSDKNEEAVLKKKIFNSILGFSIIIKEIERLQKPIIGHNILTDLILIYQQFYNQTPVSYSEFKQNIHRIFPCVYDTKIVSSALQTKIPREECWVSSSLGDLYSFFKNGNGAKMIILSPLVLSRDENYSSLENFHEAGFDSYCTGFCFVKMAYMYLLWDERKGKFVTTTVSKTITSLLAAVRHLSNQLHVSRSEVRWIALDGQDPKKTPPQTFRIQSKKKLKFCLLQITEKLAEYHSVDFKPLDSYSGVIAVHNRQHAKEIRQYFEFKKEFVVTDYSFLKHSFWGKTITRSFFVSVVLGVIITSKVIRSSKFFRLT